jgi:hypothetical protein
MPRNGAGDPDGAASSSIGPTRLIALAVVVLIAIVTAVDRVREAIAAGPEWDTYAFLANAAEFAGKGFGYTEPHRPPLISLLTSMWFRFAPLSEAPIQWIDGALTLSGVVAFYLLFSRRVSPVLAAGGALAFLGVTPVWDWLGVGYTDTAAIALCAWALLATIAATERHPGFYLLAGPLFTAAGMMRFTALLFAFPLAVWLLLRWRPFRQARHVVAGVALAVGAYLPLGAYYGARLGDSLFPFLFAFTLNEVVTAPGGEGGATAQAGYYLENLPTLLGPPGVAWAGILLMLVAAYGLFSGVIGHLSTRKPATRHVAVALLAVALVAGAEIGLGLVARQIAIPIAVLAIWRSLGTGDGSSEERVGAEAALDATMLAWFAAYLDFHGHQTLQIPRYFITMAPGIIYFTVLGWHLMAEQIRPRRLGQGLAAVVAVVLAAAPLVHATRPPVQADPFIAAARSSAVWMNAYDREYADRVMYSDLWPLSSWYLGTRVYPMPFFEEIPAFEHELEKARADYFFTLTGQRFDAYREAHVAGPVAVLERGDREPPNLPRVLYLGKSWDNYIESLVDYDLYLESTAGRYGFEGTSFLDALSGEELAAYDAVAAAGFRWRDRAAGEAALQEHLDNGGSIVIDASQNLGGLAHSVLDTIMFDTVVRRGQLPPQARVEVSPSLAARYPGLSSITATPWIDEGGGPWGGAIYEARPGTPPLEVLATVDGRPLVQVRHVGKGRVYWLSYNLAWHAFSTENRSEARLISAVFDDALATAREARTHGEAP